MENNADTYASTVLPFVPKEKVSLGFIHLKALEYGAVVYGYIDCENLRMLPV